MKIKVAETSTSIPKFQLHLVVTSNSFELLLLDSGFDMRWYYVQASIIQQQLPLRSLRNPGQCGRLWPWSLSPFEACLIQCEASFRIESTALPSRCKTFDGCVCTPGMFPACHGASRLAEITPPDLTEWTCWMLLDPVSSALFTPTLATK